MDIHSALSWIAGAGAYGASKAALWSATNSLRLELAGQGTQVVGVHLGYADTDLTAAVTAPKLDPRDVARLVVDGIEDGSSEVLVDDVSRYFKQAVAGPVEGLSPAGQRVRCTRATSTIRRPSCQPLLNGVPPSAAAERV